MFKPSKLIDKFKSPFNIQEINFKSDYPVVRYFTEPPLDVDQFKSKFEDCVSEEHELRFSQLKYNSEHDVYMFLENLVIDEILKLDFLKVETFFKYDLNQYRHLDKIEMPRKMYTKLSNASGFISTNGGIGPANHILIHPQTIVEIYKIMNYDFASPHIANGIDCRVIKSTKIPLDKIILGRTNKIDQAGIHVVTTEFSNTTVSYSTVINGNASSQYSYIQLKNFETITSTIRKNKIDKILKSLDE